MDGADVAPGPALLTSSGAHMMRSAIGPDRTRLTSVRESHASGQLRVTGHPTSASPSSSPPTDTRTSHTVCAHGSHHVGDDADQGWTSG